MQLSANDKLNSAQLNLMRAFQFLRNEQEIKEIDSLVNFYLEKKLDEAIEKAESSQNYTVEIYEQWLNAKRD